MSKTGKFNVTLPGYSVTNEDGTPFVSVGGVTYSGMNYEQLQVIQAMYVDFAERMVEIGNSMMTPEQKARFDGAMAVGKRKK